MKGFYSVFNPRGEKIADCGAEKDALTLLHSRNARWEGHYYQYDPLPGYIIDVTPNNQLPTRDIVINMDGGVGGSWHFEDQLEQLSQSNENPLDLE
tara:strand:+ start:1509 stop:1796 length:288 start_codon:yes stop_codon:yes gene_type:complete